MTKPEEWSQPFERIRAETECARQSLRALTDWLYEHVVGHDVLPRQLPDEVAPLLERLDEALHSIGEDQRQLWDRCCSGPAQKFALGRRLNMEEYHLLRAWRVAPLTVETLGLSPVDDFGLWTLLYYEDDERYGYINPGARPRATGARRVAKQLGIQPEEIRRSALNPEQQEFFERNLPEVYARFKGDE